MLPRSFADISTNDVQTFAVWAGIIVVAGVLLYAFVVLLHRVWKSLLNWLNNATSSMKSYPARVVAKRTDTSGHTGQYGYIETEFYVTFEFNGGIRREYEVSGEEFGLLVEGDEGVVFAKGTRYEGFERAG